MNKTGIVLLAVVALTGPGLAADRGQPRDSPTEAPARPPPAAADVRAEVFAWLDAREVDESTRAEAEALWSSETGDPAGSDLLWRLARTFALVDENARELVEVCSRPLGEPVPRQISAEASPSP